MKIDKRITGGILGFALLCAGPLAFGAGPAGASPAPAAGAAQTGGNITVLESSSASSWALGLDPATNTNDLADAPYMNAIYGQLFEQGKAGLVPELATGYHFGAGAKSLTLTLRHGVKFSDGTPFNAKAVAFNIKRDLTPSFACICDSSFPVASVTTPNQYTVVLHLSKPFSAVINAFPGSAPNWIASPTALAKMGEKAFAQTPVGAGPFEVQSDTYSSVLVLKKNPNYWQPGHPYLDGITFKSVGSDESSYEAVVAGSGQMAENVGSTQVVQAARKELQVNEVTGRNAVNAIQFNTTKAPFNNVLAREAVSYATDASALSKALTNGTGVVIQSPSLPGSAFYEPKVPGYRTYNPAKAKALLGQLGGLSITLNGINGPAATLAEAVASEWQQVGIQVKLNLFADLVALNQAYASNNWQVLLQAAGGINPAVGTGGSYWRYYSTAPFTGVKDANLDKLINEAAGTPVTGQQVKIYKQIDKYLSQKAYFAFLYLAPLQNLTAKSVHGPGVSTPLEFPVWSDVWLQQSA